MDRQNNELVQRALKIIREQGGRGLKVAALADQLGVSRRTLQREMKKQRNTTPTEEILRVRLERARELLTETDHSLRDIATMLGFVESSAFTQFVRLHTGRSPRDYRKENKNL